MTSDTDKETMTYSVKICRRSLANEHLCSITWNAATATLFSEHTNDRTIATVIANVGKLRYQYLHLSAIIFPSKTGSAASP